jgi:hypothetical protein
MSEERFEVHPTAEMQDCVDWLKDHHYASAIAFPPRTHDVFGKIMVEGSEPAILIRPYDMPMEPPLMVIAGDTLIAREQMGECGVYRIVVVIERA